MRSSGRVAIAMSCAAGCSFTHGALPTGDAPTGGVCLDNVCRLRFDTAAEWADAEAMFDVTIDPDFGTPPNPARAALTPAAYVTGAVVSRGADAPLGAAAVDWVAIDTAVVAGMALDGLIHPADSLAPPPGVGLTDNADWTFWIEGEIELPAGNQQLELYGDDFASLQIGKPGVRGSYTTIANATYPNPQVVLVDAGAGGWFPFRAAVVQTNGGGSGMTIGTGPEGGAISRVPRTRLRARVEDLRGTFVLAWDDRRLAGPMQPSHYTRVLADDEIDQPLAPGLTSTDDLSQRWFGQLRAEVAGDYTLAADTDDGNRIYLAGQMSSDLLESSGSTVTTSVTKTLRRGWNDLVFDYDQMGGNQHARLGVSAAPAGVATGPIPIAMLRPVLPRRFGGVTHYAQPRLAIPNNDATGVTDTHTPDAFAGETVREVRVAYDITHPTISELDVELTHDGVTVQVRNSSPSANHWHTTTQFDGHPLAGPWSLRVDDENGGDSGTLDGWSLTVITDSGPGQIASKSEWISTVKDLGSVVALDALDAAMSSVAGSSLELYLRTCDAPASCDVEAWSGPVVPGSAPVAPLAPVRRYAQLRAVMLSNGLDEPALDFVELAYRIAR